MSITVESPPFTPTSPRGGLVARCIAPLKFTGKTRRDRSRIHHGDDLRGPPEIRHAARGCPRRPRSSAILLHANPPPVYEPWRSFEENDEPRVGLPARSFILFLLVSLLSRASDKMLRASRSRFQEDALRAIYESLYRRWGVVLPGFLGNSIGGEIVERRILMEFAKWKDFLLTCCLVSFLRVPSYFFYLCNNDKIN